MDRDSMKHESLDCTDMKALLSAYIDDEMDGPTRHLAERHLAECDSCRALVNEAEGLDGLIAMDAVTREQLMHLSDDFQEEVLARTAYAQRHRAHSRWTLWTGWMTAAACLALAAVIWVSDLADSGEQYRAEHTTDEQTADAQLDHTPDNGTTGHSAMIRPAAYTTGFELQSETYEGTLPAEVFRLAGHRGISSIAPRPGAGWTQPQLHQRTAPFVAETEADVDALHDPTHLEQFDELMQPREGLLPHRDGVDISHEDLETLRSTAQLMEFLEGIDLSSFTEVEWMRSRIEADTLLEKLYEMRDRVSIEHRPAVYAAEAVMHRIADGPLDRKDVEGLRDTVAGLDLAKQIGRISRRSSNLPPL